MNQRYMSNFFMYNIVGYNIYPYYYIHLYWIAVIKLLRVGPSRIKHLYFFIPGRAGPSWINYDKGYNRKLFNTYILSFFFIHCLISSSIDKIYNLLFQLNDP